MKKWRPLKAGDVVDVVAPGYATPREAVDGARKFLTKWGLIPRIPRDLIAPHFLHAHDDENRLAHLKRALLAEDSAAVWCLRGGYGSNRLLPALAKLKAPKEAKLFVGISDITSLHVFLNREWQWNTIHGPLLDRMGRNLLKPRDERELKRLVFGDQGEIEFSNLKPMNTAATKVKKLNAPIIGGNLTVLQSLIGTPWAFEGKGHFLFIEDLGERGYRIDRMLEQFRQAGILKGCRGLLVGDFLGGEEPQGKNLIGPVFRRWAQDLDLPMFSGLEAGHAEIQRPVPFGVRAQLIGGKKPRLIIPSGGRG
ncbi:MAG: LD-carboxypeptidase [Bdellovibrionaceae bacterium]|nr:LD-carboxypeptidase [Pseudobdellovibrionaceae bacterium]